MKITANSTLKEIGEYVKFKLRKSAEELWDVGQAVILAHFKCQSKKKFEGWCKATGLSVRTGYRYMTVGKQPKASLAGLLPSEVYSLFTGEKEKPDVQQAVTTAAVQGMPARPRLPSGAVKGNRNTTKQPGGPPTILKAGFEGKKPVKVEEQDDEPESSSGVPYQLSARVLLVNVADLERLEDLIRTGQAFGVLRGGKGQTLGKIKFEVVSEFEPLSKGKVK